MSGGGPVAAVVLTAGRSARMGRPKALLPVGRETFLERVVGVAAAAGLDPVRVVVGPHGKAIAAALPALGPLLVPNPDTELGQLHSLRLGLHALPAGVDAAVMFLVDHPLVRPDTVRTLVAAFRSGGRPVVVPVHGDRRGHPVLFGRAVFAELLEGPLEGGARRVVRADPSRVEEVAVDDSGILADVDTPEQYEELIRHDRSR